MMKGSLTPGTHPAVLMIHNVFDFVELIMVKFRKSSQTVTLPCIDLRL